MPRLSAKSLVPLILISALVAAWPFRQRETTSGVHQTIDDRGIRLKSPFAYPLQVASMPEPSPASELYEAESATKSEQVVTLPEVRAADPLDRDEAPPEIALDYQSTFEAGSEIGPIAARRVEGDYGIDPHDDEDSGNLQRYRIRDGDTLPSIARKYLGDESRFAEIYELNKHRLPYDNLDLLPVGGEILIP